MFEFDVPMRRRVFGELVFLPALTAPSVGRIEYRVEFRESCGSGADV
ncbi:hypothetical protein [Shimia sp.]